MTRFAAAVCAVVLGTLAGAARLEAADPPPKAAPPKQLDPSQVPPDLADWTPRPALGKAELWEKATDKDWIDARFREMNTGPFLNATFRYPIGKGSELVYKGTAIRLGEKDVAGVLFDRNTLQLVAGWTDGYLSHSDRRFGLLNTPTPQGKLINPASSGPEWANTLGKWVLDTSNFPLARVPFPSKYTKPNRAAGPANDPSKPLMTAPLPRELAKYQGLYVHGNRVVLKYTVNGVEVLDTQKLDTQKDGPVLVRTLSVGPRKAPLLLRSWRRWSVTGALKEGEYFPKDDRDTIGIPEGSDTRMITIVHGVGKRAVADDMASLTKPGPARWGQPLVTDLVPGDESGPFAVDTLTLPYANPFKALFFCTGIDHLPDGRVAVCTCHGDVWLARIDEAAKKVHWQRFATGLYHPLGLKVIDGKVIVLERGQLTRLHDHNADGEADFYECVNNDWHTGAGEHSYDTCLETDPAGNYYFFKTGDTDLPHGGCLMKVSKDGSKCEVFCTGFRHPIGLGLSPTGIVTGADQEGNWMPATRIDQYKPGGFYGDMRAHHRKVPPKIYDGPLCWLPREVDNSAGGQVWVPTNSKWPLAGLPIHFSFGRCKAFVLLRQELPDGTVQGGVSDLHMQFLSGVCRGRFHPTDGHLYVCGLNGWQTSAKTDGCVQRVRYTGKPLDVPEKMEVVADGVKLTFSRPLDRASATDPANFRAAWWNYKWSGDYGSKRYKFSGEEGQDDVTVKAAEVSADGRTVLVKVGPIKPVMQMQIGYNVAASDGKKVVGSVYLTVHQAR